MDMGAGAARGADSHIVGMRPLACAGCGGREAEIRVTTPSKGGGQLVTRERRCPKTADISSRRPLCRG
jgi:hypothetical protein